MWEHLAVTTQSLRFVKLSTAAMSQLLDGDLEAASAETGVSLTEFFLSSGGLWIWRYRLNQLAGDPESADWVAQAVLDEAADIVVGYAGYHGKPDEAGMVEIGYSVDPAHRRRGYATAMLRELLRRAADEPQVKTVRATISPDNAASLATIAGFGFTEVGEQWDEEDGLEIIFERPAR